MRKNGSRLISFGQYRLTDLFLFAVILVFSEGIIYLASRYWFADSAYFTLSFALPIILLVMVRWGWWAIFYCILDGLMYCWFYGLSWQNWIVYAIGNSFMALLLIFIAVAGKERITSSWYITFLFVAMGWILMCLGRTVIATLFEGNFLIFLGKFCGLSDSGLLTLVIAEIVVLLLRRLDGLWEDQVSYLKRMDKERKEKQKEDTYGHDFSEIDEESLSILKRWDDGLDN